MTYREIGNLIGGSWRDLKGSWKSLLAGVVLSHLVVAGVLLPLGSAGLHLLVRGSGRQVLADTDIALFLLTPWGWAALLLGGAVWLSALALQQAALLNVLALGSVDHRWMAALVATIGSWKPIFLVSVRLVFRVLLWSLPFVAALGLIYVGLLTRYDINYYLSVQPAEWWWALALAGGVLGCWLVVLVPRLLLWYLAFPLVMFADVAPSQALAQSSDRMRGKRRVWFGTLAIWLALPGLAGVVLTSLLAGLGHWLLDEPNTSLTRALVIVGALTSAWAAGQWLLSVGASAWHAALWYRWARQRSAIPDAAREVEAILPQRLARYVPRVPRWLAVVIVGASVAAAGGVWSMTEMSLGDRASVTAHRGASGEAPENTLAAFRLAIEQQADWVELDVQLTADGHVVVFHDRDLKKATGDELVVERSTLAQLQAIDIGSRAGEAYRGERIPTLAEALAVCRDKVGVNIELKFYGQSEGLEEKVVEVVERHGRGMRLQFMSLKADAVAKLKRLRPRWKVGLLAAVVVGDLTRLPGDFYAVNADLADPPLVARVHRLGKEIYVWTVNDEVSLSQMSGRGVDSLITDYPARARHVLELRSRLSPPQRLLLELAPILGLEPQIEVNPADA